MKNVGLKPKEAKAYPIWRICVFYFVSSELNGTISKTV